jgi:perosamine synthetase
MATLHKHIDELPLMDVSKENIVLCHPHIPRTALQQIEDTLKSRWIGQGPKVNEFEKRFSEKFGDGHPAISVGSGTDALHLAYILANIQEGDEVITPVFTCTATNIPLLYERAKIVFSDVQKNTLNIDPHHVAQLVNERTKAIVCVHYGGLPCDMKELKEIADTWGIPIIEDAAHGIGGSYHNKPIGSLSQYTTFSFQAIKHITTGDGGMVTLENPALIEKAKRIRWFGIDRSAKQKGIWENDIQEVGYKYQMTDIAAALGLAALDEIDETLSLRKSLLREYERGLLGIPGIEVIGAGFSDRVHAAWLCTITAERRHDLQTKLREQRIESGLMHYRNDRYSIFEKSRAEFPHMDSIDEKYLVLPLHTHMSIGDVQRICSVIKSGW